MIIDKTERCELHMEKGFLASDCSAVSLAAMSMAELVEGCKLYFVVYNGRKIGSPTRNKDEATIIFRQCAN